MHRNDPARFYDRLTPRERFELVLDAMARGDTDEVHRLAESCPRKTYLMGDMQYNALLDASRRAAIIFTNVWLESLRRYCEAKTKLDGYARATSCFVGGFVHGVNRAWKAAGKKGGIDERKPLREVAEELGMIPAIDRVPDELETGYRAAAGQLKGVYQGLLRFCQAIGIEPEKLLAWYKLALAEIESLRDVLDDEEIPVDEAWANGMYQLLCTPWIGLEGGLPQLRPERPAREETGPVPRSGAEISSLGKDHPTSEVR